MDLYRALAIKAMKDYELHHCLVIAEETAEYNGEIAKRARERAAAYRAELQRREDERNAKAAP